jgi:AcrR family transcriptional regulator
MCRVANRLNVATMSLYRHVPGKAELVSLMLDVVIGRPPLFPNSIGWRAALTVWARAYRDVFVRHPWTLRLVPWNRTLGPNELTWVETALRVISVIGLPMEDLLDMLWFVNGYVRNAASDLGGAPAAPSLEALRRSGRVNNYPVLAGVLARTALPETSAGEVDRFEFGLARALDSIELYIRCQMETSTKG